MSLEKDITAIKGLVESTTGLSSTLLEKLRRLPDKEYTNVDLVMRDGTIVEKVRVHNCSEVLDGRDINFNNIVDVRLRFVMPPIRENVIVQNAIVKSHDFPVGLFWYNLSTEEVDYEPYRKSMYHTDTIRYKEHAKNSSVVRGRVFKDGEKNFIMVYPSDFVSFDFARPQISTLFNRVSEVVKLHISGIVDEGGLDLAERKIRK